MKSKTIWMIIIFLLLVTVFTFFLGYIYTTESRVEFYAKVKEVRNNSHIINPYPNEAFDYEEINLIIPDKKYQVGDIIKIVTDGKVMETYPVTMHAINTKLIKKEKVEEITTTPIEEVSNEIIINEITGYIGKIKDIDLDQAKTYVIDIVDYIFNEKEILSTKFINLSNEAKLQVIRKALELDDAINKKFPNYKSALATEYRSMKGKLVTFYLEKTSNFCENNDAICNDAKQAFLTLKDKLNLSWAFVTSIKEVSANELQKWYEIYQGK